MNFTSNPLEREMKRGPRPAALRRLRAALCAGGEKGVLFGGLRRKCAAETPARLYAEKAAGLLAFAA